MLLRDAGMDWVMHGRPLPLEPAGLVRINDAAQLLETNEGGAVFVDGTATWCYGPGNVSAAAAPQCGSSSARPLVRPRSPLRSVSSSGPSGDGARPGHRTASRASSSTREDRAHPQGERGAGISHRRALSEGPEPASDRCRGEPRPLVGAPHPGAKRLGRPSASASVPLLVQGS